MAMWKSRLAESSEVIDGLEGEHNKWQQELLNARCVDCGEGDVLVFCPRCADVHRALGTHISKVKGCRGALLQGPVEITGMLQIGSAASQGVQTVPKSTAEEERMAPCQNQHWKAQHRQELWQEPVAVPAPPPSPAGGAVAGLRSQPTSPAGSPVTSVSSPMMPSPPVRPEPKATPGMLLGRRPGRPSAHRKELTNFDALLKESVGAMDKVPTKSGKAGTGFLETPSGIVIVSKPGHVNIKPDASDPVWDELGNW